MSDLHQLPDFTIGTLLAVAAAILFGAHTSFSKVKADIINTIYKIYFLFGSSITCFVFTIFFVSANGETIHFTYLGLIAAILFLFFEIFLLLSVQRIGIGYATGFTVFSACITAPIAQQILGQPIKYWYIMAVGLIILSISVFIISLLNDILKCGGFLQSEDIDDIDDDDDDADGGNSDSGSSLNFLYGHGKREFPLLTVIVSGESLIDSTQQLPLFSTRHRSKKCFSFNTILGLLFSSLSGICMDLLPFPSLYADENSKGKKFFLSFGIGCILMMPLCALMIIFDDKLKHSRSYSLCQLIKCDNKIWRYKNTKNVVGPAITAGILWSTGNICSFLSFLYLTYTTAIAYVQCQIIVALLCRVLLNEIRERVQVISLILLCLLYLAGCVVVIYGIHGIFPSLF